MLVTVREAMAAGAVGIAMGRNIWGHKNIAGISATLTAFIHNDAGVDTALARRYRRRAKTGERHSAYLNQDLSDNFDADRMEAVLQPLDRGGHVVTADTAYSVAENLPGLEQSIERLMRQISA